MAITRSFKEYLQNIQIFECSFCGSSGGFFRINSQFDSVIALLRGEKSG